MRPTLRRPTRRDTSLLRRVVLRRMCAPRGSVAGQTMNYNYNTIYYEIACAPFCQPRQHVPAVQATPLNMRVDSINAAI